MERFKLAHKRNIFSVFQFSVCQVLRVRGNEEDLFTFGKMTHTRQLQPRFVLSSAWAQLRKSPDVGQRSKEAPETAATGQSPMMPPGTLPGLATG